MNWIPEDEACKILRRSKRTLRRYTKSGIWPVAYSAINGRRFFYSEKDIEKLMNAHSSKTK